MNFEALALLVRPAGWVSHLRVCVGVVAFDCTQLKHWRRGKTIYRELLKLGASEAVARLVAGNGGRWRRNSRLELNRVLTIAYFDRSGMVRLT